MVVNTSAIVPAPVSGVPSPLWVAMTVTRTPAAPSQIAVDVHFTWYLQSSSSDSIPYIVSPYGHMSMPPSGAATSGWQLAMLVGCTIWPPSPSEQCVSAGPAVGIPGAEHVAAAPSEPPPSVPDSAPLLPSDPPPASLVLAVLSDVHATNRPSAGTSKAIVFLSMVSSSV